MAARNQVNVSILSVVHTRPPVNKYNSCTCQNHDPAVEGTQYAAVCNGICNTCLPHVGAGITRTLGRLRQLSTSAIQRSSAGDLQFHYGAPSLTRRVSQQRSRVVASHRIRVVLLVAIARRSPLIANFQGHGPWAGTAPRARSRYVRSLYTVR